MSYNNVLLTKFAEYKDGDNYIIPKEDFERIFKNLKNFKIKKKMCSYFIWMNENRKNIEKEYFSEFYNIEDWNIVNKKEYYISKGLDSNKVVKEGRPRIASLITSKAGILWKQLNSNEKKKYEEISKNLKSVEKIDIKIFPKEKKKRGRPRKIKDNKNVSDAAIEHCNNQTKRVNEEIKLEKVSMEPCNNEEEIKVENIIFNGKKYWLDIKTFEIYDPETEDIVGKKNGENIYIN